MSLDFLMKRNGYEVFVARNGKEALDLYSQEFPDLVILDIMMPNIGGYEVCKKIKSENADKTKVLILTAKDKEEDIKKGYEAGADHYMTKPFSTRALITKVKELIS
nr:response regulator [Marinigracilibium pacificum]